MSGLMPKLRGPLTIHIYKDAGGAGWRFRIKAKNGRIVAVGESYTRRGDAVRGARRASPGARVANWGR